MRHIDIEAMMMGESLLVMLDVLECGGWSEGNAEKVLYRDNGPWKTRHLGLRGNVLLDLVKSGQ